MTAAPSEFEALIARVQGGCADAKNELFAQYRSAVRCVVRRHLEQPMRRHYDSVDFEQSVWAAFFHDPATRCDFATADALVAYLGRMAYNKVMDATRRRLDQAHDARREECSLDAPRAPGDAGPLVNDLPGPTNTPSQFAIAGERWRKLTSHLPAPHLRIVELLRAGHSQVEIARQLGHDPKTIRRLLERLSQIAFQS